MTLQQLRAQIRSRSFFPLYYFFGDEDFLIEQESRALADAALADGDASFNLHVFWANENKAEEIISAANAFPFLSEKRVVIVHDADARAQDEARGKARVGAAKQALGSTGDAKTESTWVGSTRPLVDPKQKDHARNERLEIVFVDSGKS